MDLHTLTNLQRNILDEDNLIAYAYRTRKYFTECKHAIDIGCGIGYQFEQIAKLNPLVHFDLLDKTGLETPESYTPTGYAHNNLELTREYTQSYNCTVHDVKYYAWQTPANVVYSTLSWGWHYPVDLYLDKVLLTGPKYIIFDNRLSQDPVIPGYNICDSFRIHRKELTLVFEKC